MSVVSSSRHGPGVIRHPTQPSPASVWDGPPRAVASFALETVPAAATRPTSYAFAHGDAHLPLHRHRGLDGAAASVSGTTSTPRSSPSTTPSFGPASPPTTARRSARKETASSRCSRRRARASRPPSRCSGRFHRTGGRQASRSACGWASTRVRSQRRRLVSSDSRFIAPPGWRPSPTVARSFVSAAAAALVRDSLPAGASLRDLGLHRLKDLGRPEQIFQLEGDGLEFDFPPLRSLDNPALPNNLPAQSASFVGREVEAGRGPASRRVRSARHPHRGRGMRQDPARPAGGGRAARRVRRRGLARRARLGLRARGRPVGDQRGARDHEPSRSVGARDLCSMPSSSNTCSSCSTTAST